MDYSTTPTRQAQVQRQAAALERALAEDDVPSQRLRDLPTFVRLVVGREPDRCEVDVRDRLPRAADSRVRSSRPTRCWRSSTRAEPRDFTDLDAMTRVYPLSDLLDLAERKDTGFDRPRFVEALGSLRRFTPEEPA